MWNRRRTFPHRKLVLHRCKWNISHEMYIELCWDLICCSYMNSPYWTYAMYWPIYFRVYSLTTEGTISLPRISKSDVTLKDIGNIGLYVTTTKHNKARTACSILGTYYLSPLGISNCGKAMINFSPEPTLSTLLCQVTDICLREWVHQRPILLTWFNFNPGMHK